MEYEVGFWKVPSPLPRKMSNCPLAGFTVLRTLTARSIFPSPLKSAATKAEG